MIDTGSPFVIIKDTVANALSLVHCPLMRKWIASRAWSENLLTYFSEFIILDLSFHCNSWSVKPILAFISANLATPVLLGLSFIKHNALVIFDKEDLVINFIIGWDLLSGKYIEAPPIIVKQCHDQKISAKQRFQNMKSPHDKRVDKLNDLKLLLKAQKLVASELKWRCTIRC